jgi:ABC-type transporter MlaC component
MIVNKIIFKLTVFFIVAIFTPMASVADTTKTAEESVSQLLKKVKSSKGDERRKAMNALKLKLRTVNAATRAKTIQELRQAFAGSAIHSVTTPTHSIQQVPHQQMMNTLHQNNPSINHPPVQKPITPMIPTRPQIPPGGHP